MCSVTTFGQRPIYQNYNVEDGLPSNTIYKIDQDSKGYIWIATGAGASRFNGNTFKNFDSNDGLDDVFGLSIDDADRVWFWSANKHYSYFQNGEIIHTDTIEHLKNIQRTIPNSIRIDLGSISVLTNDYKLVKFDATNLSVLEEQKLKLNSVTVSNAYFSYFKFDSPVDYLKGKQFCNGEQIQPLRQRAVKTGVFPSKLPFVWLVNIDGTGFYYCEVQDDDCIVPIKKYLDDTKINTVFEDDAGNLWIASQSKGVFFLPHRNVLSMNEKDNLTSASLYSIASDDENNIIIGNNNSEVNFIDKNTLNVKALKLSTTKRRINDLHNNGKNGIWVISESGAFVIDDEKIIYRPEPAKASPHKSFHSVNDSTFWIGSSAYFTQVKFNLEGNVEYGNCDNDIHRKKTYALYQVKDTLWIGTDVGIYRFLISNDSLSNEVKLGGNDKVLRSGIRDIISYNNQFWVGTVNQGILILKNDTVFKQLSTQNNPIGSNSCKSLFLDTTKNEIWMAGNNGVTRIQNIDNLDELKFDIYNVHDGLISNETTDVLVDEKGITWVSTKSGLTFFDANAFQKSIKPKTYITNVYIWGNDTTIFQNYNLPSDKNDIGFRFENVYFNGMPQFKYKLFGRDEDWTISKSDHIRYSRLPAGEYTFEVSAITEDWSESEESMKINFSIALPFWKTWWFIVGSIAALILFGFILYKVRVDQMQKQSKLTELSLRGVRNQMNAHFLFNSLNAIQSYVLKRDAKTAYTFLTKLSKLIRQTLYHSNQKNTVLAEEVKLLKNYMDLEKLRLEGAFEYEFHIDELLMGQNTKIQPLIIQPFIENSIRWGLQELDHKGKIDIVAKKIGKDYIQLSIIDNGIGRKKAGEIKSKYFEDHHSMGTEINNERLKLLSDIQKKQFSIKIIDLCDDHKNSIGTQVDVIMPIE